MVEPLAALVLVDQALGLPGQEAVLAIGLVLEELLELLAEFRFSIDLLNLGEISHGLLERRLGVGVVVGVAGDRRMQELGLVPEVVRQPVVLVVLLPDVVQLNRSIGFIWCVV